MLLRMRAILKLHNNPYHSVTNQQFTPLHRHRTDTNSLPPPFPTFLPQTDKRYFA